jgi:hypothetical protein
MLKYWYPWYSIALLFLLVAFLAYRKIKRMHGEPEGKWMRILVMILSGIVLFLFVSKSIVVALEEFCKLNILPHLPNEYSIYGKYEE